MPQKLVSTILKITKKLPGRKIAKMSPGQKIAATTPSRGQGRPRKSTSRAKSSISVNNQAISEISINISQSHAAAIYTTEKHASELATIKSHNLWVEKMVKWTLTNYPAYYRQGVA